MNSQHDDDSTPAVEPDTTSDPSLDDETGHDWESEGGATPDGPATHPAGGEPDSDEAVDD